MCVPIGDSIITHGSRTVHQRTKLEDVADLFVTVLETLAQVVEHVMENCIAGIAFGQVAVFTFFGMMSHTNIRKSRRGGNEFSGSMAESRSRHACDKLRSV